MCQDSNSRPSDFETPLLTTRPGLPPKLMLICNSEKVSLYCTQLGITGSRQRIGNETRLAIEKLNTELRRFIENETRNLEKVDEVRVGRIEIVVYT